MRKRLIIFLIISSLILGACPIAYAAAPTLPASFTSLNAKVGAASPFKPIHMYASMQNPPDFTWPQIADAYSYDIKVCSDAALTTTVYSANDIKYSYYNFRYAFTPGTYWWAVRYRKTAGGEASAWSVARRFRIDPSAYEYIVPDFNVVAASIPKTHPRIWFTEDTIDEFIAQKNTVKGNTIYHNIVNRVQTHMTEEFEEDTNLITSVVTSRATRLGYRAQNAALAYVLTEDEEERKIYGDYAIEALLHAASWGYELNKKGPDGNLIYVNGSARNGNDQAFFELLLRTSMAYDWMYNYMVEEGREKDLKTIQNMLKGRFDTIKDYQLDLLRKEPYNSHFWSYFGYYGITCLALIHDVDGVDDYFSQMLELNSAQLPPMSVEDGGWSKGTAYWTYAFTRDKWFMDAMKYAGYIDYYDKAWARNETLWALYMFPDNSYGSFGDESGASMAGTNHVMGLTKLGKFTDNPVAYWLRNKIGNLGEAGTSTFDAIMYADTADEKGEAPYGYPKAHLFVDQGMVGMHSSVVNSNRTSLYFRSGKYGSYNHMHADQNAFFIEHNGNKLATKSGFYDSYHSVHDKNFTRQTFSHNTVTYNTGNGQTDDSMDANGTVKQFVTHHDFDAVVGDATNAYSGKIGGFLRSIIYIRPDSYIVIDNLSGGNYSRHFEWWLNAPHGTMTVDGKKAKVVNNGSQLDVEMIYPDNLADGVFMQNYVNPVDKVEYYPDTTTGKVSEAKAAMTPDRVYFQTPDSFDNQTIIATMSVSEGNPTTFTKAEGNGYIKLTVDDDDENTVIYIRTTDSGSVTTQEGYMFDATALVLSDSTFMMVNGTSLTKSGSVIDKSNEPFTLVMGKGQMSLSANDDVTVKIYKNTFLKNYLPANLDIANMKDINGRQMEAYVKDKHSPTGIMMSSRTSYFTLYADKGNYMYLTEPEAFVSSEEMIPGDVTIVPAGDNKAQLTWSNTMDGVSYDADINGVLHKNITSPYVFDAGNADYVTVRMRGTAYNLESSWTDSIAYYPDMVPHTSYIELTVDSDATSGQLETGDSVYANLHLSNANSSKVSVILARYNALGEYMDMNRFEVANPGNSQHPVTVGPGVAENKGDYFKIYTLSTSNVAPVGKSGTTSNDASLEGISVDGDHIKGFNKDTLTYSVTTASDGSLPVIKGITSNNALYVTTKYSIASNSKSAVATVIAEAYDGTKTEYTVNVSLASGATKVIAFIKDFRQIVGGMSFDEYCEYVESIYGINPADGSVAASMKKKAPSNYKVRQIEIGSPMTGNNEQRKFTSLDKKFGWENLYFVGSDPAMSQAPGNTPSWVQAAFYGTLDEEEILDSNGKGTGEKLYYNFTDYFVPWYEFEVTRDCEVIILSQYKLPYYESEKEWRYSYLETSPYTALRTDPLGKTSGVDSFRNIYVKEFKAGEKVSLYNENNGQKPVTGYLTMVNPK